MIRFLLDTNVLLDALLDRRPHAKAARAIWAAVENKSAAGVVPAHTVTTAFYLIEKALTSRDAHDCVGLILDVFEVALLDESSLRRALRMTFRDFEDAVCAVAAASERCDYLVTRNLRGFQASAVPSISPEAASALLAD